jgi:hypothetical protein
MRAAGRRQARRISVKRRRIAGDARESDSALT